jgi:uncharacterized protein YndB with AHSA1/START domain
MSFRPLRGLVYRSATVATRSDLEPEDHTMSVTTTTAVHVDTDTAAGTLVATARLSASPDRVFRAISTDEVTNWWVRPGVFDTREWTGDLRVGGGWRATGVGRGRPYALEGEFVEIDAPRRLAHTWRLAGAPVAASTVSFALTPIDGGTQLTLTQSGFSSPEACEATAAGWRTSFDRLAELLAAEHG